MKLTTWNLNRGIRADKLGALSDQPFDVLVAQEIPEPACETDHELWIGDSLKQGLSISVRDGASIVRDSTFRDDLKFALPARIRLGNLEFNVLGIWAKPDPNYVCNIVQILEHYADFISDAPTIVCGDFNANPSFDRHNSKHNHFERILDEAQSLGLTSAYHVFTGEQHGEKTSPTLHHNKHDDRPYHIDYVFLPLDWVARIADVKIGEFERFRPFSDHCPVTVELSGVALNKPVGDRLGAIRVSQQFSNIRLESQYLLTDP